MLPGYAGNQYILDLNGDAGAFISVLAKSTVRRLIVTESPLTSTGGANTLQGLLEYKIPNDDTPQGFTTIFMQAGANDLTSQGSVGLAQIVLGGDRTQHEPMGEIIGQLAQPIVGMPAAQQAAAAATTMIQLRSGTATGTSVQIVEYN